MKQICMEAIRKLSSKEKLYMLSTSSQSLLEMILRQSRNAIFKLVNLSLCHSRQAFIMIFDHGSQKAHVLCVLIWIARMRFKTRGYIAEVHAQLSDDNDE